MEKRVLIAVGGTGGHVFPALTLAKQLTLADPTLRVLFVGGGLRKNRYFEQSNFFFQDIDCGTLTPKKPIKSLGNIVKILRGIKQSHKIIKDFSPNLVVGFGSFHTLPTLLATRLRGIPFLLHEANRIPGKVNRLLCPHAALTGVHFPDTAFRLKGKTQEIPIPLRDGFRLGSTPQCNSRAFFNLDAKLPTILVFGGSQGAQAINNCTAHALITAAKTEPLQVLQFTGSPIAAKQFQHNYEQNGIRACVKEFESRMDLAWQAADLVISRSGASTIAEALEFETPGIFIPYPHATDNHQESNADYMTDVVGGGVKHLERNLNPQLLANEIIEFLSHDKHQLLTMKQAMHDYKCATQPKSLCTVVLEMIND